MKILVTSGSGHGFTEKDAFDAALIEAGIENYNVIHLSSVIPNDSVIVKGKKPERNVDHWGYRLYAVYSAAYAIERGQEAWAGVGWTQDSCTRGGLFVEQRGPLESVVEGDIHNSLAHMMSLRVELHNEKNYGPVYSMTKGVVRGDLPISCALVAALYKVESWDGQGFFF